METVGAGLESLTMVRHGQSVANAAPFTGADEFLTGTSDADVPLTELGRQQAAAAGRRLATVEPRFDLVLCSPYVRTRETARIALEFVTAPAARFDERLRDRETGILFGLTRAGIAHRYPEQHRELERLGGFYHRPPGGESWPDVALRLRAVLRDMRGHVLVFTHDIVIVLTRYLFGELEIAELSAQTTAQVRNASLTRWERREGGPLLTVYNDTAHLD
ncbi:histidine phosphatase family protein [Nocardia yunnanensis]|uniref:histidine phosphatase family protein n=1 Tax=Nocardia yunnanensis TaxID=2382165 RepID=UPI001CA44491|nr:histidine phosphatase family protein [Nocardia yunnanensis]